MRKQKNFAITLAEGRQVTATQYTEFLRLVIERFKDPEFKAAFEKQQKAAGNAPAA